MKATALLKAQHKEVRALFAAIEKAKTRADKVKLFEEVATCLVGHDAIEREIFYPACEKAMGMTDLLGEAVVEHGVIEFSLHVADGARAGVDFDHKVQVLSEMIEHHVKEEEHEFFPKVDKALDAGVQEALASRMTARFAETQQIDFRGPLEAKLHQVIAGASSAHTETPKKHAASAHATARQA